MTTTPKEEEKNNTEEACCIKEEVMDDEEQEYGKEMDEGLLEDHAKSRQRPRKRKLYASICKQLEFYFSDANITKNRMMREMVMGNEYVDLNTFMDFNRIKGITSRFEDLQKALVTSDKLEISPDKTGVKRKIHFDPNKVKSDTEVEDCTIYVENVPKHADHCWLETIFQCFGPIAYISLPKFKKSKKPKGFAFVEFDNSESANGCLQAYKGEGACLPIDMNPAELMSIQTFSDEQEAAAAAALKSDNIGTPLPDNSSPRKRKAEQSGNDSPEKIKKSKLDSTNPTPSTTELLETDSNDVTESKVEFPSESKKKKRKKKKNRFESKTAEEKLEGDAIFLKVMLKKSWRQLRNRYLNLQRQNMSKLKKQLRDQYLRDQHYKNCKQQEDIDLNKNSQIIEILLDSPADSVDAFKKQIQVDLTGESEEEAAISGFVKYVDIEEGSLQSYVRFNDDPSFTNRIDSFVSNAGKVFKQARFLTVRESQEYKLRVQEALKQKRKEQPKKNIRGKDRLFKAASKSSSHMRFDTNENVDEDQEDHQEVTGNEIYMDQEERENEEDYIDEPESTTA